MKKFDTGRRGFLRNLGILGAAGVLGACGAGVAPSDGAKSGRGQGAMTKRLNGATGDSVSILGYGCMRLPTKALVSGNEADDEIDQNAVNESVDYAIAHGVNYFDTSPAYCKGHSEEAMGVALSRHPRDKYYIATKLSNFAPSTWIREASTAMFENSLRMLRTDYVDYLLLHGIGMGGMEAFNGRYVDNGVLDYLCEKRRQGVIRNLGFSYHGDVAVFDHLLAMMDRGEIRWDFAQIQMNYIDWRHAKEINERNTDAEYLYGELSKRGIPVVIMEPLLGGRLASVPGPVAAKMKERRPDDSLASWAFRFAGTPEGVLTVLSGMTYMEHLKENIATYSALEPLDAEEDAFLQRMALEILQNDTVPCTDCKYCMPCPYGVDIPGIFAHYNRCINEGTVVRDGADPDFASSRSAFLFGYDRAVPRLRQADRCVGCGACLSHCPQGISIPGRLHAIAAYAESLRASKI